jgi:hypothetical protein
MGDRNLIVHSKEVERYANDASHPYHDQSVEHLKLVEEVRGREGTVEMLPGEDPRNAGEHFERGDRVKVYGVWREVCIPDAEESLNDHGVIYQRGEEPYSILPDHKFRR